MRLTPIVFVLAALLACKSGSSGGKCAATVTLDGKPGQGTGDGDLNAAESACIDWCVHHDPDVDEIVEKAKGKASGKTRFAEAYDAPGGPAIVESCKKTCISRARKGQELRVNCP